MTAARHLERRIVREVAARKEAERLLEAKSEEIYEKNRLLEASRKRLEQALELVNSLLGVVPDILITCNDQLVIEMVNESSVGILGFPQSELVGSHITKLFPSLTLEMNANISFIVPDIKMVKADGSTVDTEIHGDIIETQGRRFVALLVLDIEARKAAEKMKEDIYWQLQEARRLEAIGALSGGIAHELNTPIQFIGDNIAFIDRALKDIRGICMKFKELQKGCAQRRRKCDMPWQNAEAARQTDLEKLINEVAQALKETREGIAHVGTIIGLVKEFSHPGTGAPETVDINTVINHALAMCRFRCKALSAVDTDLITPPPPLKCFPSQIQQVLINIVVNAVEAIEEKGRSDGHIHVATEVAEPYLRIEISDNGPGIEDSVRQHIFAPFFTTKKAGKGTGQGLALAREIIAKHDGRLYLGEKPGFATTFVVELPLAIAKANKVRRGQAHVPA